jgi:hypothetical protein
MIATDRHRSNGAALMDLGSGDDREMGRLMSNRPRELALVRRQERAMLSFRRMRTLQKFASVYASVRNHFPTERHLQNRHALKTTRGAAPADWLTIRPRSTCYCRSGCGALWGMMKSPSNSSSKNPSSGLPAQRRLGRSRLGSANHPRRRPGGPCGGPSRPRR